MSRYSQNARRYADLAMAYSQPRQSELSKPIKDKGADNWRMISEVANLAGNLAPIAGAAIGGVAGAGGGAVVVPGVGAVPGWLAGAGAGGAVGAGVGQGLKGVGEWAGSHADQPLIEAQAREKERLAREADRQARLQMVMSLMGRR